jgi:long-chain acyl-CoA synthetase
LDHDLSVEGGELTPSLKVKRSVVAQRYREVIDSLYR